MLNGKKRLPDPAELEIALLDQNPVYQAALAELTTLERRLNETQQRRQRAQARLRGAKPSRTALERAKDLLRGGQVQASDPSDDLRAADEEEFGILLPAIREATRLLDDVHGDASLAVCERLRPQYRTVMIAALHAIEDLRAALDTAAGIRARVRAAGYSPLSCVLPDVAPAGAVALGDPTQVGQSQSYFFKKALEESGIL